MKIFRFVLLESSLDFLKGTSEEAITPAVDFRQKGSCPIPDGQLPGIILGAIFMNT